MDENSLLATIWYVRENTKPYYAVNMDHLRLCYRVIHAHKQNKNELTKSFFSFILVLFLNGMSKGGSRPGIWQLSAPTTRFGSGYAVQIYLAEKRGLSPNGRCARLITVGQNFASSRTLLATRRRGATGSSEKTRGLHKRRTAKR